MADMRAYMLLGGAILTEILGTSLLKVSDGFSNMIPGILAITAYIASFYFISLTLTEFPVGLVYATWSAVGIVGLALVGVVFFDETIDLVGIMGFLLVIGGIALLNVYSDAYSPV